MSESGRPNKRRDPDPTEFNRLLLRLGPETGEAWAEYERLRRRLVKFLECSACTDAEALADEVLDRVAKRADLEQIRSVPEFAIGVARNVSKESHRKERRESRLEDAPRGAESLPSGRDPESEIAERIVQEARLACLEASLAGLNERDRYLALEYYDARGVKQHLRRKLLAAQLGWTINALRVHMARLREKLEKEVLECMKNRQ